MAPQANAPLPSMTMDPRSGMPSRNLIVEDIVARTGIDEVMIDRLVRTFYARARLYEAFRPAIPAGARGWGAAGELDLDGIASFAHGEP